MAYQLKITKNTSVEIERKPWSCPTLNKIRRTCKQEGREPTQEEINKIIENIDFNDRVLTVPSNYDYESTYIVNPDNINDVCTIIIKELMDNNQIPTNEIATYMAYVSEKRANDIIFEFSVNGRYVEISKNRTMNTDKTSDFIKFCQENFEKEIEKRKERERKYEEERKDSIRAQIKELEAKLA